MPPSPIFSTVRSWIRLNLAFWSQTATTSGTADISIYSRETKTATTLIGGDSTYQDARFSPDGRFIAYVSDDSSRLEVYVQELVYLDLQQRVTAVSIEPQGDRLKLGTPGVLFRLDGRLVTFDAAGDHQRFLVATQEGPDSEPLHIVLNWPADLK